MSNRHAGARDRATLRSKGVRSWRRSPSIAMARTSIPTTLSGAKRAWRLAAQPKPDESEHGLAEPGFLWVTMGHVHGLRLVDISRMSGMRLALLSYPCTAR